MYKFAEMYYGRKRKEERLAICIYEHDGILHYSEFGCVFMRSLLKWFVPELGLSIRVCPHPHPKFIIQIINSMI